MSASQKRSFASFVKLSSQAVIPAELTNAAVPLSRHVSQGPSSGQGSDNSQPSDKERQDLGSANSTADEQGLLAGEGEGAPQRTRIVTPTGRVRTYTATRNLPGVTYRMTENRWERLKMLSIQERRPIQEILGEALQEYMRRRGLPW
jgi:hypothetical protein